MDVQTETVDPPPCESQSSGKIRKGFKLFGKRKPGNIFSIRGKGDGNNKSPVHRSKTLDGLTETAAPDSEQDPDKEKGQEVSQGDVEQGEEETLGEDGVLAAAHARTSISSASSAKSLSFLSLLRGGRRGVGDRRVHTVSQPVGRHRRGLKGLFGNVKFRSKDKDEKEDAPPSPLLMSSRANSVEIIKEDLTLTPKSHPRSLDSPETESGDPIKSFSTQDSSATTPSETLTAKVMAGNVSKTDEHVSPISTPEPPLVPGDNSLSSLLADISSLLTFDSITGGGDIMADVEAEWGKASSAISPEVTPSSTSFFSKPSISSPLTSTFASSASPAKPSPVAVSTTTSTKSFTPLTKTTLSSSPSKPSTIITTLTKSSTLTTHSVRLSSDSSPGIKIKSSPMAAPGPPSTTPVTITSFSSPIMSSPTIKSMLSSTSATTTAPPNTPATVVKAPAVNPVLTSTVSKLASEAPQIISSINKPSPVAAPPPAQAKTATVSHSPPTPVAFVQPPPAKLDPVCNSTLQTSTSYKPSLSSAAGVSEVPVTVSQPCTVTPKPSIPEPVIPAKIKTAPTSTTTPSQVSAALSKPTFTSSSTDFNQTPSPLVTAPCPSPAPSVLAKTQPSVTSAPAPPLTNLDKIPLTTKPTPAPVSVDKPPLVSTSSPTPPALGQIPVSQSKTSTPLPPSAPILAPVSKDVPAPTTHVQVSESKASQGSAQISTSEFKPTAPAPIPISVSKDAPAAAKIQLSQSKPPSVPSQIPVSETKASPAPAQIPNSGSKPSTAAPAQIPVSEAKSPPAPAQIPICESKAPPAPTQIPLLESKAPPTPPAQIPISVPKDLPTPAQIQIPQSKEPPAYTQIPASQPKAPTTPTPTPTSASAPFPVTSPPSTPSPCPGDTPDSARMKGSARTSVDEPLASPCSTDALGTVTVTSKTDELHNESRMNLQGPSRDKRPAQAKAAGHSKIPVVGGGRVGKIPVRESQHVEEEANRAPLEEERPHFNSHDVGSRDKISDAGPAVSTSKHTLQEESQQLPQPKTLPSVPRDSKIPVKHGAQSHPASQIPQAKEPPRTKIPVSKVPVRRVGNKPAAAVGGAQIRK